MSSKLMNINEQRYKNYYQATGSDSYCLEKINYIDIFPVQTDKAKEMRKGYMKMLSDIHKK